MKADYSNKHLKTPETVDGLRFQAGEVIIKQGFPGDHAYIIKQGTCEVVFIENDLSETLLAELHEGEMFGELALLEDEPRNATVRAKTDVILQVMAI